MAAGNGNYWKYGLALGVGVAVGAVAATIFSRSSIDLKKTMANVMSHGMDLKDKAAAFAETAKENLDDIAAEARDVREKRKHS